MVAILICVRAPLCITAGYPFVPARDKDEVRVDFQRTLPLFLKVQSEIYSSWPFILFSIMPASAHRARFVTHGCRTWRVRQGILCHTYAYLLCFALCIAEDMLRIGFQPAPLVRTARALPVIRHTAAEGEETQKLLIFDEFLVRQQQRLALPEEPQILPQARLIQIAPELVRDRARISERREKRNGRSAHPVLAHPSIFAAKRLVFFAKSKRR